MDICKVLRGCQWSPVRTSCTEVTRASGFPQFENVLNTLDFSTILQCRQVEAAGSELSQTRPHDFRFQILTQAFTHCLPVVAVYFSLFHRSHDSCSLRSLALGLAWFLIEPTCHSSTLCQPFHLLERVSEQRYPRWSHKVCSTFLWSYATVKTLMDCNGPLMSLENLSMTFDNLDLWKRTWRRLSRLAKTPMDLNGP